MKQLETNRQKYFNLKLEVLTHYGGGKLACVKCGFNDIRALSIDHINNDGGEHRKVVKSGRIYKWLRDNHYPEGYQTLCMNCQFIKKFEYVSPNYTAKIIQSVSKRARIWVARREMPFYTREITLALGFQEKETSKLRPILCRLVKEGKLERPRQSYYKIPKKDTESIKVFG